MKTQRSLPRGHAYIEIRNAGSRVTLDFEEIEHPQAQAMMDDLMKFINADADDNEGELTAKRNGN